MKALKDKVAVITGGNSGIGYATAKEFKEQGATVIITGRRKEAIEIAAKELGVTGMIADQSDVQAVTGLAEQVNIQFGKIDILFINAGIIGRTTIADATESMYDEVMGINLKGAYFTLSKFIPLLNDGASVVFLSSNVASTNNIASSIYSSSKAALNSVMRIAALELAPRKIRVNAVSPGPTETEILNKAGFDEATLKAVKTGILSKIPLGTMGKAGDVGKMVAYFCSDASSFITGAEIIMDGGMRLA
ncbi:SDR family oxidoreductase [Pedobacter zeae]|uniref:NAD(P)-dependent dehydrogenase (Short-subunit alcohol dehydrogenase family) n=1 Tax=Pedobacter zeae TaxID=1737356 RepID=A0A7W6P6F2_9SPHI|nr:SDR family oxidoreductase [Pedobacter zeae]MBB4109087.1 NAD(P)-dependent dehydrogenase (short-subunit alcohol dehydrogenase family) [Pedobacter zeae]GGH10205.1 short-chain dehydrogenase [Pedobacter zeae]